jgi:DNA-binding MarR family transcriptional regulator
MEIMSLQRLSDLINTVEVHIRLDKIRWANAHGEKIDPVADFINRYVYVQHCKELKVTISELSSLLEMSENSLRRKIKDLEYQGLLDLKTDPIDRRRTLLYPTAAAVWIFEGDAVRRAKTFFDESVRIRLMFEKRAVEIFKSRNMDKYPSYKPTKHTTAFHKETKYGYKDSKVFTSWKKHNKIPSNNYPK